MALSMVRNLRDKFCENISYLPDDVKMKIYKEYFEPKIKESQLKCLLLKCNSFSNQKIIYTLNVKLMKYSIENENVLNYLLKKDIIFKEVYDQFVNDTLMFKLITDKYEKFFMTWFFRLYH